MEVHTDFDRGRGAIPIEFCTHCGSEVQRGTAACQNCGCPPCTGRNYCRVCGTRVGSDEQAVCLNCGALLGGRQRRLVVCGGKSSLVAVLLSFLWCGLGQLYLGQTWKGVAMMVLYMLCFSMGLPGVILWVAGMVDAHRIGKKLEREQDVGEWEFF